MTSLVRNTGLAAEATEFIPELLRSSMRHDGECLQQSQFKLLIHETALAGWADWQLVDHFDRNVEHAAHTLANGTQCSFQAFPANPLAGYDFHHDPSEGILIVLVFSDHTA